MIGKTALSRREFLGTTAAAGFAAFETMSAADPLVYVGTYTENTQSKGIHLLRMNPQSGALRPDGPVTPATNPSFLAVHPNGRFLYAVNEVTEFGGQKSGAVSAFLREPGTGGLTLLNQQPSRGGAPCYVAVDRTGRFVLVANYVGGNVAVFPVRQDGSIGQASSVMQHEGAGKDPDRQSAPHAHSFLMDPANRFALAADLGIDRVMVYRLDGQTGTLARAGTPPAALKPGAGPRHLAFHPHGRNVYVVNELDVTVTVFRYDAATGALTELQTVPALAERTRAESFPADIHLLPSGRFLYASIRGDDSLAVFSVDRAKGTLTPVQRISTGGRWPRSFAIDPTARFLFVANQRSDSIVGFRIDPATGRLTPTGPRLEIPSPVCIRFGGAK